MYILVVGNRKIRPSISNSNNSTLMEVVIEDFLMNFPLVLSLIHVGQKGYCQVRPSNEL